MAEPAEQTHETALVHRGTGEIAPTTTFTRDQIDLIKETVCRGATDSELRLFLAVAGRCGLDPFTGQIHAVKRWVDGKEVMSIQTGIDGYRLIAQRSGEYEGQVGPQWCAEDGVWTDSWTSDVPPTVARVGVFRRGFRDPVWGVARFAGYVQRKKDGTPMARWRTDPAGMLAKCAEALGLRKAFPRELSGLYSDVEMEQADQPDGTPRVRMPGRKSEPKQEPTADALSGVWVGTVRTVEEKSGKTNNKIWTLYTVVGTDGEKFGTFDTTSADFAREAGDLQVRIAWETTKKGNKNILEIGPAVDED